MNAFEKYNLEDVEIIKNMIKKCKRVYAYVKTSSDDGVYLEVKKPILIINIHNNPMAFGSNQFELNTVDNNLYIN